MYFGLISNFYWSAIIINDGDDDANYNNNNNNNINNNNTKNNIKKNKNNNKKNNRTTSLLPLFYIKRFVLNIYFFKSVSSRKTKHDLLNENSHCISYLYKNNSF